MTIGPKGEVRPVVHVHSVGMGGRGSDLRYTAVIQDEDGVAWTFTCTHLHAREDLARKCFKKLTTSWERWVQPDVTRRDCGFNGVVEFSHPGERETLTYSRRMSPITTGSIRP